MEVDRAPAVTAVDLNAPELSADRRIFASGSYPSSEVFGRMLCTDEAADPRLAANGGCVGVAVPVKRGADRAPRPKRAGGLLEGAAKACRSVAKLAASAVPPLRLLTQTGAGAAAAKAPPMLVALHPHRNRVAVASRTGSSLAYTVRIYDLEQEAAHAKAAESTASPTSHKRMPHGLNASSSAGPDQSNPSVSSVRPHDMTVASGAANSSDAENRLQDGTLLGPGNAVRVLEHADMTDIGALAWKRGSSDVLAVAIPGAVLLWHTEMDVRRLVVGADAATEQTRQAGFDARWAEDDLDAPATEAAAARRLGAAVSLGACVAYLVQGLPAGGPVRPDRLDFCNAGRGRLMAATSTSSPLVAVFDLAAAPNSPDACVARLTSCSSGMAAAAFTERDALLVRAPKDEPSLFVASTASWAETTLRLDAPAVDLAPAPSPAMGPYRGHGLRVRERVAVLNPTSMTILELAARTAPSALALTVLTVPVMRVALGPLTRAMGGGDATRPAILRGDATRLAADLLGGGARIAVRFASGDLAVCAVDVPRLRRIRFRPEPRRTRRAQVADRVSMATPVRRRQPGLDASPASAGSASESDAEDVPMSDAEPDSLPIGSAEVLAVLRQDSGADVPFGFHDHRDASQPLSLLAVLDSDTGCLRHMPLSYSRRS